MICYKLKKFFLLNFSILFILGIYNAKPSYADSDSNADLKNNCVVSTDVSNENKSHKNLFNNEKNSNNIEENNNAINKNSSDESNLNLSENKNTDDKTTGNVNENKNESNKSDSYDESNSVSMKSKENVDQKEIESNIKPKIKLYSAQNDGNFVWDNYGRCRYVYNDGSVPKVGFIEKNNNKYYTYGNGYIYTNQFISFGSSVLYYMDNYGRLTVGKFKDNSNKWRYSNNDGNLVGSQGWKINNQGKHYAHGKGELYTNQLISFGSSVLYYMGNDGRVTVGKFKDNSNKWRYSNNDGNLVGSQGWKIDKQGKHYAHGKGELYTNQLISFGSSVLYYMGNDGRLTVGKFKDNSNKWRYSNNDGNLVGSQGWKIDKQGKHYAHGNGYLYTNQFITFGPNVRYYMNSNGLITTSPFKYKNIVTFNPSSNGLIRSDEYNSNIRHIRVMNYAKSILNQVGNSLWGAYKWAGSAINYKTMTTIASNGITYFANVGFNQRKGNCYTMASAFYYMAKALGYNVHQVSGYYQGYNNRQWVHSWCEIHMNGNKYVYDPDVYKEYGRSIFGKKYGQSGTLKYLVERNKYMHL